MNRLHPLVRRRRRAPASFPAAALVMPAAPQLELAERWMEDARTFAGGWVAGLVIFGTLFG